MKRPILFLKAHVKGYIRKDGTSVSPHSRHDHPWFGDDRHVAQIEDAIKQSPHRRHGLRVMSALHSGDDIPHPTPGTKLGPSHKWADGTPTNRKLSGTSTIKVTDRESIQRAIRLLGSYWGRSVVLVGGDYARKGEDDGEAIISNATVVRAWSRKANGVGRHMRVGARFIENDLHADHETAK